MSSDAKMSDYGLSTLAAMKAAGANVPVFLPGLVNNRILATDIVDEAELEATIGDIKNGGDLESSDSIEVPNNAVSRVTTLNASAVTLNVTVASETDVPNFAVMIHAAANATLSVTKTIHEAEDIVTPIRYSVDAGNELVAGKTYQVTCVGDCWTLAEFAVPADATYTFGGLVVQVVAGEGSAVVTDGSDLVKVTEPIEVSSFAYDRTFASGVKATLVLPFALSDASKITSGNLYEIVDVAFDGEVYSGVLGNSPVTAVEANHPYVYEPTTSGPITVSLGAGETLTLVPTPDETTTTLQTSNGTWIIHGTYASISDFGDLPNFANRALYAYAGVTTESINAGDFGRIGPGASISPMRLYLERVVS